MGFGTKQGFPVLRLDSGKPTLIIKGGGGKVAKSLTQANPSFTLTVS